MLRLFVAAELDPKFIHTCQKIQQVFLKNEGAFRLTPAEQIHLTLVFLGDTADEFVPKISETISRAFGAVAPTSIEIEQIIALPRPTVARVIALKVDEKNLGQFSQAVSALRLGLHQHEIVFDAKAWHPHITVARTRQPIAFAPLKLELLQTVITKIKLVASQLSAVGPNYETLFSFKLV
jgi:RNA 2',3'-cyclic 3'-phosphodiesterase